MNVFVCIYVYIYVRVRVCVYELMYDYVCTYVCMYISMYVCMHAFVLIYIYIYIYIYTYRVSQEECTILRESVPYVKLYRYNPKHLYPKLNVYGDNGHRKVGACVVSTYCSLRDAIHVHCT